MVEIRWDGFGKWSLWQKWIFMRSKSLFGFYDDEDNNDDDTRRDAEGWDAQMSCHGRTGWGYDREPAFRAIDTGTWAFFFLPSFLPSSLPYTGG